MHLRSITFTEPLVYGKHEVFAEREVLEFKHPVTLLVGDQGCGKSTLLDILALKHKAKQTLDYDQGVSFYHLDTEKDNPRRKGYIDGKIIGFQLNSMFSSHGQTILALMKMIEQGKDCLFFIDEPESGLSIRSQFLLLNIINEAVKNNVQFVIATHSVILIEAQSEVLDLERRTWCSSEDFITSQKSLKRKKAK